MEQCERKTTYSTFRIIPANISSRRSARTIK